MINKILLYSIIFLLIQFAISDKIEKEKNRNYLNTFILMCFMVFIDYKKESECSNRFTIPID